MYILCILDRKQVKNALDLKGVLAKKNVLVIDSVCGFLIMKCLRTIETKFDIIVVRNVGFETTKMFDSLSQISLMKSFISYT